MARSPFRIPVPLAGGGDGSFIAGGEVHPIAQWVEPARSGASMPATGLPLTAPGMYYGTDSAQGVASRLWLRREAGDDSLPLTATVFLNGANTGTHVTISGGDTQAEAPISVSIAPGDDVRAYITGGDNTTWVSGLMATPTRLFRFLPAAIGRVWVMESGGWVAPTHVHPKVSGAYETAIAGHIVEGGIWTPVI